MTRCDLQTRSIVIHLNRITATGAYMCHRFSWASFKLNNFSIFCPFATFDSSKCS
jgi:hypothetical protein